MASSKNNPVIQPLGVPQPQPNAAPATSVTWPTSPSAIEGPGIPSVTPGQTDAQPQTGGNVLGPKGN
jgi:hypothetical protein